MNRGHGGLVCAIRISLPIGSMNTPIAAVVKPPDPIAAENAALKAQVAGLEGKLSKIATDFEGNNKKFAVVDRLVKALAGEGESPDSAKYKQAWGEIKEIAKHAAPQV